MEKDFVFQCIAFEREGTGNSTTISKTVLSVKVNIVNNRELYTVVSIGGNCYGNNIIVNNPGHEKGSQVLEKKSTHCFTTDKATYYLDLTI